MWVPTSIAQHRPLTRSMSRTPLRHDIITVHTMVGTLPGSWSWSNRPGGSYWHFGTSGTGEAWQCQDLRYRSAANLNGNHRVIPIENADMGPGFGSWNGRCGSVPGFTTAQINKLVQLITWLCRTYNIPPVLIPDTAPGRRGISYHRQGIDPWRKPGTELWSKSRGKCCPDDRRIHQTINVIIPRVQAALRGGPLPPITTLPTTPPKEWDELATKKEIQEAVRGECVRAANQAQTPRRMVREGYKVGDPIYLSDLVTWKFPITRDGALDNWSKDLLAINGLSKNAHRVDQKVINEIPTVSYPPSIDATLKWYEAVHRESGGEKTSWLHKIIKQAGS